MKSAFLLIFIFLHSMAYSFQYELSICAIFQNEARFLKEWIDYHRKVGVQHFWLFNNDSQDNYKEVLKEYCDQGIVELIEWPTPHETSYEYFCLTQFPAYDKGVYLSSGITKWLAIIDIDEYLIPVEKDNLIDFLKDYESYGGVVVNWIVYGTSNIWEVPENNMLGTLFYRNVLEYSPNYTIKTIVQPDKVKHPIEHSHCYNYLPGYHAVDSDFNEIQGPLNKSVLVNKIRCNHYAFRDMNFFLNIKLGRQRKYILISDEEVKRLEKTCNQVFDDCVLRIINN